MNAMNLRTKIYMYIPKMAIGIIMKTERAWDEAERLEIMKNVQIQRGGLDW
jgi:hypothetical protein